MKLIFVFELTHKDTGSSRELCQASLFINTVAIKSINKNKNLFRNISLLVLR